MSFAETWRPRCTRGCARNRAKNSDLLFKFFNRIVETAGSISVRVRINSGLVDAQNAEENAP